MPQSIGELGFLVQFLVLLAAMVITAPLARRFGQSAVVGYLLAGIAIGPWGLQIFRDPSTVATVAQFGVIMLLFVIGLELKVSRLLAMRRDIFGLGAAQMVLTASVLTLLLIPVFSLGWRGALVAALGIATSGTAIALQILDERGDLQAPYGQRSFSVLLFQDLSVVPILALLPLLALFHIDLGGGHPLVATLTGVGAIAALVLAGLYLLNPLFRMLAATGSREAMTAAALLLVVGAAVMMQSAGLSMALGAFLAGLLLSESNFRHQLEADIEPFRGLLLALFFMSIGMAIDVGIVVTHFASLAAAAAGILAIKAIIVAAIFRLAGSSTVDGLRAGLVLSSAGEFAFVFLPIGYAIAVLTMPQASLLTALAAFTMLLCPPAAVFSERVFKRFERGREDREPDDFSQARGSVIVVGFGRFGQIVSQAFLAQNVDVTAIDNDVEMIQSAERFGFKVYYGDGARLDVLRAAGASRARLIAVCVNDRDMATRILEIAKAEFSYAQVYVRSFDRRHTLELLSKGADFEMRETFESALAFGGAALEAIGVDAEEARETIEDIRLRDLERLALQQVQQEDTAGLDVLHRRRVQPEPLTGPRRTGRALSGETEAAIKQEQKDDGRD